MTAPDMTLQRMLSGELPLDRVGPHLRHACRRALRSQDSERMRLAATQALATRRDTIIVAIGQSTNLDGIKEQGIAISGPGGLEADPVTLQTPIDWVFAGGDAVYGPKSVVDAVACGKEVAESIHRFINGMDLAEGRQKEWDFVKPDVSNEPNKKRTTVRCLDPEARECNFLEVSFGYNEAEAKTEAERCLECGVCSECYQCVDACLAEAVNHDMVAEEKTINVGAIILAPGFTPFDPSEHKSYPYASHPNVVTSLEMERILSASGPFEGHLVRPSDHKEPEKIAWFQCVGSRDINCSDHSYCSSVCCMYTNKQTIIAKEHSDKDLDTAVFFMDMRTMGKEFERFYESAKQKGIRFVRSRVHTIDPVPDSDDLNVRYVTDEGETVTETYDQIVLSIGLQTDPEVIALAEKLDLELTPGNFCKTDTFSPVQSSREGIYVCGAFQGPKDIPQSVVDASAAASAAGESLSSARNTLTQQAEVIPQTNVVGDRPKIGVIVCECGINIAGVVDVPAVRDYAASLPYVDYVANNLYACSQDSQETMSELIKKKDGESAAAIEENDGAED